MPEPLDADAVRRVSGAALAALRRHEREINDLNVYPVPDGDTGTNLTRTLAAADAALAAERTSDAADAWAALAGGAARGARGNSGVIVAQLLRAVADTLAGPGAGSGRRLAAALVAAADAAYRAVAEPVEGTILTVARAAGRAAVAADSDDPAVVARAAATGAAAALARTPEQLQVLATAAVVDAGGRGWLVLLDALAEVLTGDAVDRSEEFPAPSRPAVTAAPGGDPPHPRGSPAYAYEVQYLLDAEPAAVERLRDTLGTLGDSLVVVGTGDGGWNVHVHVNDVGAALEAGVVAGRPHRISVTRFDDPSPEPAVRSVVVAAAGPGLATLFTAEGARVVGSPPAPAELAAAVRATGAGQVVILPNDADAHTAALAVADAAGRDGVRVAVVPTRSPVQALAALAVRDSGRRFDDDVIAMAEAAGACRYAEICHAERDALTVAGRCRPGDVLGLVEGEVYLIGTDLAAVCGQLLDRLLGGGGELVSLVMGEPAPAGLADQLRSHLVRAWPFVEVQVYDGGQPGQSLLIGVE